MIFYWLVHGLRGGTAIVEVELRWLICTESDVVVSLYGGGTARRWIRLCTSPGSSVEFTAGIRSE